MVLMSNIVYIVICATVLCGLWCGSNAELYSATDKLPPLLNTYKLVINDLDEYIQKEEMRLFALKKNVDLFKKEHAIAMEDTNEYLGNPINAFTLIKRLTMDLRDMVKNANLTNVLIGNVTKTKGGHAIFPDANDLIGAAKALTRLQETYNLPVDELADGKIKGVSYSLPMSADDCFGLGNILYYAEKYNNSIEWMSKALQMYEDRGKTEVYSFTSTEVNKYIEWSLQKLELPGRAKKESFEDEEQTNRNKTYEQIMYKALCRGEYEPPPEITKRLTCFYLTKHHPFLRIAPFKAEQLYIDPDVFIFYDVISEKDMVYLRLTAMPLIKRARSYNPVKGNYVSDFRTSQSVFMDYSKGHLLSRITDLTGLSVQCSEPLQIVNYGIGGQHEPHLDHGEMSDVSAGGATVFPYLGLSAFPVKGAALFWMNLLPSGEGDAATLHAGCPVLRGSKWIAAKWLRLNGQMFHRPCSLEYQDEDILRPLPAPVLKSTT